jgi:cyclic beta-1,2-glucan synthetase
VAAAARQHRWARGDWQLLPWIAAWRRGATPAIGRWKMLDNLRRTLSAPAALLLLLLAWRLALPAALVWTGFVVAAIALPTLLPLGGDIAPHRQWITWRSYLRVLGGGLRQAAWLTGLTLALLAHQAVLMLDAIGRTLLRMALTRRHLLQWVTAAQGAGDAHLDASGCYRRMTGGALIGLACVGLAAVAPRGVWMLELPLGLVWLAAPAIACWSSRYVRTDGPSSASAADIKALRLLARRTWRYFETFVTATDNMLPPDNFQQDPAPVLAHRTSPTNIGLYLLSVVSACDFGWIGLAETLDRLEATLASMAKLARFRGHFLNWYDTTTLQTLEPAYVSTVDSGNLAGHLIALASACRLWREQGADDQAWRAGVGDALQIAADAIRPSGAAPAPEQAARAARLAADAIESLQNSLLQGAALDDLSAQTRAAADLVHSHEPMLGAEAGGWIAAAGRSIGSRQRDEQAGCAHALPARLAAMEEQARGMALRMEFGFLRNETRKMLSIGYLVAANALDANCYDLLASEARLAVYLAIAKGDLPAREWFRLGRAVTPVGNGAALVSWSGSMFEYLMPSLVMRAPCGSLLEQTSRRIVQRQISYGAERSLPWGVSESAYNVRDLDYTYQYSNFGVPGLGLKRGLGQESVVAPYATVLAAMVDPAAAVGNLARLAAAGGNGRYGFYEALDYTPGRVPNGQPVAVVYAFMAHHQGMSVVAAAAMVLNGRMRARFHAEPMIEASELLLQERALRDGAVARPLPSERRGHRRSGAVVQPGGRLFTGADSAAPATHLLSNGSYTVMLTSAGSGYSRWRDLAVTRWREDATLDAWGCVIYLRDASGGPAWSAGWQPTGVAPDAYKASFAEDRAEFVRRDGELTTTLEILVSAEDDAEVRRITLDNAGPAPREVDLTSYAELVLTSQATDVAHPAFAKLFVQTEYLAETNTIVATRRRRDPKEPEVWAAHLVVADGPIGVETDRARFLGRGHGMADPAAMTGAGPLSGTVGTVLDAVFALRCRVTVPPGGAARVAFWTLVAPTRAALLDAIDKHHDNAAFDRAATLAWTQAQVELHHLGITPRDADLFQRLASHLLFAGPALRPSSETIQRGAGPQSGLWAHGISGDLPILLLRIADPADIDTARQIVLAHEYFGLKRLAVDLVILNEHPPSYAQDLQTGLEALLRTEARRGGGRGSVVLLRADLLPQAVGALLAATARVVFLARRGSLGVQLDRAEAPAARRPAPVKPAAGWSAKAAPAALAPTELMPPLPPLELFNGTGGFADDGRDYVVVLGPGQTTPAPWINVIANAGFGFQVSAEGSGYTWAENSQQNQLTPWSNDPVSDRAGEAFYLQDAETLELWCPTAGLARDAGATYVARHGHGYSRFERIAHGIASCLLQYVPPQDPVKIGRLRLHNLSGRARSLSVTTYVEWVLGPSRGAGAALVATGIDAASGAMFARNRWSIGYDTLVAFADLGGRQTSWTGDRRGFIGRNGALARPDALAAGLDLANTVGAGMDPCGALRTTIELPPDGRVEIVFLLGQAASEDDARRLVLRYRQADLDAVLASVRQSWAAVLGAVQVSTPDRSMDIMLNGWLLYQTLSCRIWARAGFYQASGAYGFRDQLQDGMALTAAAPAIVRDHLLQAAARQFTEGDVQHWWLPRTGAGVRTRIADDCGWLAYTVAHYVMASGDAAVLDEPVGFLAAPVLKPEEQDRFFAPAAADGAASLFEHCARALDHSLALGSHGLPLMQTGDWNDGMNRIGEGGKGESVWLGWFLHAALLAFARLADDRRDTAHAAAWRAHAVALAPALERAWDGAWYLRAFFDDGAPLGSHANAECRIDAIAQSWAVISGAAMPDRAARAMRSVAELLVRDSDGLVLVLAPPFDGDGPDPGYIRGYPPGIRETGGQYTHAALWTVMAIAALGDGAQAARLFARLNPINHTTDAASVARYKVEPYVVVGDIYSVAPHDGRGGWSWYTGSAGWMQRVGIESILGVRIRAGVLRLDPCIPPDWPQYTVTLAWRSSRYAITVSNPDRVSQGVVSVELDGARMEEAIMLRDDGATHTVAVRLGGARPGVAAAQPVLAGA